MRKRRHTHRHNVCNIMNKFNWKGHGSMLVANSIWGLMSPIAKIVMAGGIVTPLVLSDLRIFGAMVLFWIVSLFCKREHSHHIYRARHLQRHQRAGRDTDLRRRLSGHRKQEPGRHRSCRKDRITADWNKTEAGHVGCPAFILLMLHAIGGTVTAAVSCFRLPPSSSSCGYPRTASSGG